MDRTLAISLAVFAAGLIVMIALRSRLGEKLKVQNPDIIIALIPVALWIFLTGKLTKISFAGLSLESAFTQASAAPITPEASGLVTLPVEEIRPSPSGGVEDVQRLVEKRTEALTLTLGQGGYQGQAIRTYIETLTRYPYLKHIVINNPDGTFFGLIDVEAMWKQMEGRPADGGSYDTWDAFARWVNAQQKDRIRALPGFIAADQALKKTWGRGRALRVLKERDAPRLPVVDDAGRLAGVVDRSKLAASLLVEVEERLGGGGD